MITTETMRQQQENDQYSNNTTKFIEKRDENEKQKKQNLQNSEYDQNDNSNMESLNNTINDDENENDKSIESSTSSYSPEKFKVHVRDSEGIKLEDQVQVGTTVKFKEIADVVEYIPIILDNDSLNSSLNSSSSCSSISSYNTSLRNAANASRSRMNSNDQRRNNYHTNNTDLSEFYLENHEYFNRSNNNGYDSDQEHDNSDNEYLQHRNSFSLFSSRVRRRKNKNRDDLGVTKGIDSRNRKMKGNSVFASSEKWGIYWIWVCF